MCFLKDVLNNASKIQILVTGFSNFEKLYNNFEVKFHELQSLSNSETAKLLLNRAPRDIM